MRQNTEKHGKTKVSKVAVSVLPCGKVAVLGGRAAFIASECGPPAGSELINLRMARDPARGHSQPQLSSCAAALSVDGAVARAARLVFEAGPNNRSPQAATIPINEITEQRCCAAA